ncbi:MAG: CDP-diacylglycerol O-phosphatidyltransferase [Nocardioides sp.]|nr:CDP-diacylglycerol O-phosphatidyltransferase [Nocardioides sp.]
MTTPTRGTRFVVGLVHAYTSLGVVLGLLMVHYAYQGEVRTVLWLILASIVIDGTDGFLARHLEVKRVMPGFDGALLDNIVDYLTYAFAPMVLLWSCGYLPSGLLGAVTASVPLLASCYQFCRTDAKTEDHLFLGFPSYWNIVAFYVVIFGWGTTTTAVLLFVFSALVFVPVKYVYPSRTATLWSLNMTMAVLWLGAFALLTALLPQPPLWLSLASLIYPVYYTVLSLWLTLRSRRDPAAA